MTMEQNKSIVPYTTRGTGNHAVVLVHGFLDAGEIWDPVIEALTAQNLQTVTLDLPGMGALTDDTGEISLERYASEVGRVIQEIGKPVVLVGQSMGTQVVELAAVAHPELVAGLVLITPVPLGGVNAPLETIAPFKQLGGQREAQRQLRLNLSHALAEEDANVLTRLGENVTPAVVSALVDSWNNGHPKGNTQSQFAGPVLILSGKSDPFVTTEMIDLVAGRFAHIRHEAVQNAGHWAHVEQAKAVARMLDRFLAEIDWTLSKREIAASDWKDAFASRSASDFANAFAEDVVLEATVLHKPISGRDNVKRVMATASTIYEELVFTKQATQGHRQYVEWKAKAFGGVELLGVSIITRNEAGSIARVAIHHRPLQAALKFSTEMGERLRNVIDPAHFFQPNSSHS